MSTFQVKLRRGQQEEPCELECSDAPPWRIRLSSAAFPDLRSTESDLFEALGGLRKVFEPEGWRILCVGSRVDAHPSGMQRDMAGGRRVYLLRTGAKPTMADVRDIFDPASIEDVGTVEEQERFYATWLRSVNAATGPVIDRRRVVPLRRDPPDTDRTRGALLGLAVGDALGTTLEFTRPQPVPFPTLPSGPHRTIVGGGPFHLHAGQVTDDTQMAICLAESISSSNGYSISDVCQRYQRWVRLAFDAGNQTRAMLAAHGDRISVDDLVRQSHAQWRTNRDGGAGNGALMRTVPIAVAFADEADRICASTSDAMVTHFDPRCQLACVGFNASIALAVSSRKQPSRAEMIGAARHDMAIAASLLRTEFAEEAAYVDRAFAELDSDLARAASDDPFSPPDGVDMHRTAGFVRVAFRVAYWHLLHAPTFESALISVVNRGGDADTNGAIAGALLGAYYGEDAIPETWRAAVLGDLEGAPDVWRNAYHPRKLMDFARHVSGGS